jgi:hypothetical protein
MTRAAIIGLLVLPVVLLGCGNPLTPYPLDYVPPDPCHLVSSAEVGEAAGFVVSEGTHDGALTCHWDGPVDKGGNPEPTTTQLAVEQAIATLVIPRAGG